MGYIPLFMTVTDQPCMVIGGDAVAEERVRALLDAGARVTVISSSVTAPLKALVESGRVEHRQRGFRSGDLAGFALAYCTEHNEALAREVAAEARSTGVPINLTDRPELCSFIAPAVVRRGALQIAVSTAGASPALAGLLRRELEAIFSAPYETLLAVLAAVRSCLRAHEPDGARRRTLSRTLASALREPILRGDHAGADAELRRHLGIGLADLGLARVPPGDAEQLTSLPGSE